MELIKTVGLAVGFNGNSVLSDMSFSLKKDRITVILGKSGCGKSTLLKTLVGLIPPIQGDIYFEGDKVDYFSERSLQFLYRRIGVLYQNGALLNSLNLYDNIALPIRMNRPGFPFDIEKEMVLAALSKFGLEESWAKYPAELSGGMRKRASLARAMILDPDIIFCDEPSAGLDPLTSRGLDEIMLELKEKFRVTLVVVTHELRSIEKIADDVIVIRNGGIHFCGAYREMLQKEDLFVSRFFLKQGIKND